MMSRRRLFGIAGILLAAMPWKLAATEATEEQLKAVILFNFLQFVQWPAYGQDGDRDPFVIGVLGDEPLATQLNEAVREERVNGRAVKVLHYRTAMEIGDCHILFLGGSNRELHRQAMSAPGRRGTLTVSDQEESAAHGVMIELARRNNRFRLLINLESARAAGLTISSNLLRPAEIVRTTR